MKRQPGNDEISFVVAHEGAVHNGVGCSQPHAGLIDTAFIACSCNQIFDGRSTYRLAWCIAYVKCFVWC